METNLIHRIRHRLQPKRDTLFLGSIVVVFVCLLLLAGYFWYNISQKTKAQQAAVTEAFTDNTQPQPTVEAKGGWTTYKNPQYQFVVELPRFLAKREYRDKDGYTFLAIFEENSISKGKGVAIGITSRNVNAEVAQTKVDYAKSGEAELSEEKDVEVAGEAGKQVTFKPKNDDKALESHTVIMFHHGNYTYSISTVPEQAEHIVGSFKWL